MQNPCDKTVLSSPFCPLGPPPPGEPGKPAVGGAHPPPNMLGKSPNKFWKKSPPPPEVDDCEVFCWLYWLCIVDLDIIFDLKSAFKITMCMYKISNWFSSFCRCKTDKKIRRTLTASRSFGLGNCETGETKYEAT